MTREPYKRPRRNPLTSEEVSQIIAHRQKRELVALHKLKKSRAFKVLNIFHILCMFIYLEVVFCYFGPCHYQRHYSYSSLAHYGGRALVMLIPGNIYLIISIKLQRIF